MIELKNLIIKYKKLLDQHLASNLDLDDQLNYFDPEQLLILWKEYYWNQTEILMRINLWENKCPQNRTNHLDQGLECGKIQSENPNKLFLILWNNQFQFFYRNSAIH